jgi:hypothetical protein
MTAFIFSLARALALSLPLPLRLSLSPSPPRGKMNDSGSSRGKGSTYSRSSGLHGRWLAAGVVLSRGPRVEAAPFTPPPARLGHRNRPERSAQKVCLGTVQSSTDSTDCTVSIGTFGILQADFSAGYLGPWVPGSDRAKLFQEIQTARRCLRTGHAWPELLQ